MKDRLVFKDFVGAVHFSAEDQVFFGKIVGIDDLVTFEGDTVKELNHAFEEAVEDYIELCQETGKEAFKTLKGSFNVRIQPELHSKIYVQSLLSGKTLNQFVKEALEEKVSRGQLV